MLDLICRVIFFEMNDNGNIIKQQTDSANGSDVQMISK